MCFLHIPPENSSYTAKNGDDFDTLINDICNYSSCGDLMLCGDFNARTSSDPDFILYDKKDKGMQNDPNYIYDLVNVVIDIIAFRYMRALHKIDELKVDRAWRPEIRMKKTCVVNSYQDNCVSELFNQLLGIMFVYKNIV